MLNKYWQLWLAHCSWCFSEGSEGHQMEVGQFPQGIASAFER